MNYELRKFAESIRDLRWREMVRVADYIVDELEDSGEPLTRDLMAGIMDHLADDILVEWKREKEAENDA